MNGDDENGGDDGVKRIALICAGSVFVVLGVLGILLPILPTTPFLLLSSACYFRASQKCHHWLLNNRLFGSYIRSYIEGRGIPAKTKISAIIMLWFSILISVYAVSVVWVKLLLIIIAVAVTVHIILIKPHKDSVADFTVSREQ